MRGSRRPLPAFPLIFPIAKLEPAHDAGARATPVRRRRAGEFSRGVPENVIGGNQCLKSETRSDEQECNY
jgi:hypothetical protein